MAGYVVITWILITARVTSCQVFQTHPTNSTILQGGIADFRCRLNGIYPCNNIHWVKYVGTGHIQNRDKTYISSCMDLTDLKTFDETRYSVSRQNMNEYRLEILDVRHTDAGAYGCVFEDENGTGISRPSVIASLNVLNSWPTPICSANPPNPSIGTTVKFSCYTPLGSPTLPLTWAYQKASEFGGTRSVKQRESYDVFWRLETKENYEYFTCFAGYGSSVKSCTLIPLKIPPTPVVTPEVVKKMEGDNAEFRCKVAINTPSIQSRIWFVVDGDQKLRRFSNSSGRYRVLDNNASFRIKQLTERDNNTHVWCTARNDRGIYSEARGTARLIIMPIGSTIIRNPFEDTADINFFNNMDETTSSMNDISASNTTKRPRVHSAAVVGGTAAALFLLVVVIALWIYLLKGKTRFIKKRMARPDSMSDASPLTVMTTGYKPRDSFQMCPYEPPDVLKTSIVPSPSATLPRSHKTNAEDVTGYTLPTGYDTMRILPPFVPIPQEYQGRTTHTLPVRNARGRKTHTVCMTYQDTRGSSLPASPIQSRRSRRQRETVEDVKLDFRDRHREASFIPANNRSRTRASCRLPLQSSTMSHYGEYRTSTSCPNSPRAVRSSRRRHTKDEVVLYALPLQKGGTLRMKSSGSIPSIPDSESSGEFTSKKRPRFGTSISRSKSKKRSFVSSLSLSELRLGSRRRSVGDKLSIDRLEKPAADQKQSNNVEGLVYADLQLSCDDTNEKSNIIGHDERTVYADIKGISMQL